MSATGPETPARRRAVARCLGLFAIAVVLAAPVRAQAPPAARPRRSTTASAPTASGSARTGRFPTARTRSSACSIPDGSVKSVVPPTPTADERADAEARERQDAIDRAAKSDAVRRDRNLVSRFPNEAEHNKARAKALDDIGKAVKVTEQRVALLTAERKPLLDEAEFYVNKPLPTKLKAQLDANDASLEAQKSLIQNQQAEVVRINALYDAELARLRKLWAGAPAGSLGPLPATPGATLTKPADSR